MYWIIAISLLLFLAVLYAVWNFTTNVYFVWNPIDAIFGKRRQSHYEVARKKKTLKLGDQRYELDLTLTEIMGARTRGPQWVRKRKLEGYIVLWMCVDGIPVANYGDMLYSGRIRFDSHVNWVAKTIVSMTKTLESTRRTTGYTPAPSLLDIPQKHRVDHADGVVLYADPMDGNIVEKYSVDPSEWDFVDEKPTIERFLELEAKTYKKENEDG